MSKKCILFFFVVVSSLISIGCSEKNADNEKKAIAEAINSTIGWFENKDFDLLFSVSADDEDYFIFHPTSDATIHGIDAFREFSEIWKDPDTKYVSHSITDLRIHLHESFQVAWFSAFLDDCGEYQGEKSCYDDARWTGVLEKRKGKWVIMQMHFSFAEDLVRKKTESEITTSMVNQKNALLK